MYPHKYFGRQLGSHIWHGSPCQLQRFFFEIENIKLPEVVQQGEYK